MTDSKNADDAEELLQQSKEQSRHTTEASPDSAPSVSRVDAIKEALVAIEDGDAPENINVRDARLKALLVGLDGADELDEVATSLLSEVDADVEDASEASQSDVARLLLRVGLQEALPEVYKDAMEARKQKALEEADSF